MICLGEEQAQWRSSGGGALHGGRLAQAALGAAGESVGRDDFSIGFDPNRVGSRLEATIHGQACQGDEREDQ